MIFAITSQKRGGYVRAFESADKALEELMGYFTPGDSVLSLHNRILRVEILREDDIARGWTLSFSRTICVN